MKPTDLENIVIGSNKNKGASLANNNNNNIDAMNELSSTEGSLSSPSSDAPMLRRCVIKPGPLKEHRSSSSCIADCHPTAKELAMYQQSFRPHSLSMNDTDQLYRREIAEEDEPFSDVHRPRSSAGSSSCHFCHEGTPPVSPRECLLPITELPLESHHKRQRLVSKDGTVNVQISDKSKKNEFSRDMFDLYTTLLEMKWSNLLGLVCLSLILSWICFGILWYLIAFFRGDIGYRTRSKLPINSTSSNNSTEPAVEEEKWWPCVENVDSGLTAFLYSLEAQTTIGFGARYPTDRCVESVFLLVIQTVLGVCQMGTIGALMAGKFIRPNRRKHALKLSKYAVVESSTFTIGSQLVIRMFDLRNKSRVIVQSVSGVLVQNIVNPKTGIRTLKSSEVSFKPNYGMSAGHILLTLFPVTFVHEVDASSPFLGMKPSDLNTNATPFELLLAVDGTMESNGLSFRKLTSYLPDEIKLGHTFEEIHGTLVGNHFSVDYQKLEAITPVKRITLKSSNDF